jgi:hypothetical protein
VYIAEGVKGPYLSMFLSLHERHKYWHVGLYLGLAVLTLLVYGQTLGHDFINFDTPTYIHNNPMVNGGVSRANIYAALTEFSASNWHPLTWISHMLDVELFGLEPAGHHATNVLLHLLNVWLLFGLLWRMTGFIWPALIVAAVFAVHPAHVESVAWIAERKDLLSGLFFMLALHSYVEYLSSHRRRYYFLLVVFAALGLMSKPMIITLPCVLLLLDYWPLNRLSLQSGGWRQWVRTLLALCFEKLPLFALSVFSAVITLAAQGGGGAMRAGEHLSLIARFGNAAVAYVFYLEKLILPRELALFYPHPGHWPLTDIVGSLVILLMITLGALYWARRYPWLLVGWAIFLGMLVPVIGVIQVGAQAAADRYTYLPSIGLLVMLVFGLREMLLHFGLSTKFVSIAGATLISALTMLGVVQASHWQNSQMIWRHSLLVADAAYLQVIGVDAPPAGRSVVGQSRLVGLSKPYLLLARAYDDDGQLELALLHYEQSLQLWPDQAETYYHLGLAAAKLGQKQKALAAFDQAGAREPDNAGLLWNLQRLRQFLDATPDDL